MTKPQKGKAWPKPKWMCYHPEWRSYTEPRPEPAEVAYYCECGENWSCLVCGWGAGTYPCSCMRESQKAGLRFWYEEISATYAGAWEALAKL